MSDLSVADVAIFVLGKSVGALLRVETWLVLLATFVVLALHRGRVRAALRAAVLLAASIFALALLPLGDPLLQSLERHYPGDPPLARVDGIIVLGGGENAPASAYWRQPQLGEGAERYIAALELARRFPEARVVFSGGSGRVRDLVAPSVTEADVAWHIFAAQGLAADRLTFEAQSRTTSDNARALVARLRPEAGQAWVLVTSAFHMPRAMHSFEAAGWSGLIPYPVDYRTGALADGIRWDLPGHLEHLDLALREAAGQAAYRLLGR